MIVDQLFTTYTVVGNTKQFFSESRHNKMLKEDVTYRKFHNLSRMIVERKMSEKEILDLFAAIEAGANATGQNRTALGRGKDAVKGAYTSAKDAISGVLNSIQMSTPVAGVDAAYNDATGALRNAVGNDSKVMNAIKKYRLLAKEYPKTQLFVKTALIALAGMATGGAGLVAIAGVTAAVDAAIKGEKLSSIIGKGVGAGLMGLGAQEVSAALAGGPSAADITANNAALGNWNDTDIPGGPASNINGLDLPGPSNTPSVPGEYSDAANNAYQQNPDPSDAPVDPNTRADYTQPDAGGGTYTIVKGDQLGFIAQAQGTTPELIRAANPDIDFSKALQPGQEINLPAAGTPGQGSLWADYKGGMYGDKVPGAGGGGAPAPTDVAPGPQGDPSFYKIDYSQPGPVTTDSMGQKLEYGIPVNDQGSFKAPNPGLQPEELAGQKAAYDNWLADFKSRFPEATQQPDGSWNAGKPGLAPMYPSNVIPGGGGSSQFTPKSVAESVKLIKLPAEQLIDQKLTMMAWALNESTGRATTRNIHLTRKGVYTVIENVDRHRRALLKELDAMGPNRTNIPAVPRQDMPAADQTGAVKPGMIGRGLNWLDRTAGKVGGYLSKQAQNFTRKVTAAKLKTEWEQKGHFTDSDQIAAFLAQQGVPQEVITDVYGKMGIPYTAPATVPNGTQPQQQQQGGAGIQTGDIYAIDPATGKPYEKEKLAAKWNTSAVDPAADGAQQPALTGGPTAGLPPAPAPGKITQPNNTTSFNATNVMQMPGMEKYAKTATKAPAKTANFGGGPTGYGKTTMSFKAPAAPGAPKAPGTQQLTPNQYVKKIGAPALPETIAQVKKMLETVETRDDVAFIKKYINREFQRHGLVSESSQAHRSHLLSEVTRIGALRRRIHSQQTAI
jgi:LysM repeat protein